VHLGNTVWRRTPDGVRRFIWGGIRRRAWARPPYSGRIAPPEAGKHAPLPGDGDREEEGVLEVVIYTEGLPFDGGTPFERSLGGSESAVVFMARELARRGHGVRVYCHCPRPVQDPEGAFGIVARPRRGRHGGPPLAGLATQGRPSGAEGPGEYDGVTYEDVVDFPDFLATGTCDVFVCCRHLRGLIAPVRSRVNVVWNHDIVTRQTAQYVTSLMFKVDRLFVLSEFHKQQFQGRLDVPEDRYVVTRNGVDLDLVDQAIAGVERDPNRVLYASRPERGLDVLLTIWPELRRRRPQLKLAIAHYENAGADAQMAEYLATLRRVMEELPDVTMLGPLNKRDLYRELAGSALALYPAAFPEVSCINALEAAACGTPMVASRYCALKESVVDGPSARSGPRGGPSGSRGASSLRLGSGQAGSPRAESGGGETGVLIPGDPHGEEYQGRFVEAAVALLQDGGRREQMAAAGRRRIEERYQWSQIAEEWEAAFAELLGGASENAPPYRRQTVSACMIVKNGQGTLHRCLESVKPIADEIIICDTGSTDNTIAIARQYTDKLYPIPWGDDFAAARNHSIEKAKCDWILWIDADEHLVGAEHLGKYLRENMYNGYVIRQHHHAIDAQFKPDVPVRLFRNHRGIRFFGCVHEHPEFALNKGVTPSVILSDVHIVHDGYITEQVRRSRFLRNLPLLLKDRKRHPERRLGLVFLERDYVHLARYELERTRGGMTEKAEEYLRRAIAIHRDHFASPEDNLHGYSLPLYQSALELLGEGIEVEYALSVNGRAGGAGDQLLPNVARRRFLDEGEAKEFLEWELRRLLAEGREEEFGFEEA